MNILTIKQSKETTELILQAGTKLDEHIHAVGVAGIAHFLQHGDKDVLTNLVKAMPKSSRGNALKLWITKHVKVRWNKKAYAGLGGYVGKMPQINSFAKIAIVMAANAEPFYEKKDTEASVWNEKAAVLSLVKKLQAFSEEHELSDEGKTVLKAMA